MRLWNWVGNKFFLSLTFLFLLLLVHGCGGIPKEAYDAIVAERDALQAELESVKSQLESMKAEFDKISPEPPKQTRPPVEEVELKYDNGKAQDYLSAAPNGGYIIDFSPPATSFVITKVRMRGNT
ncbi:MAG: hypothetical protein ACE5KP_01650 [Dehalococcoidales bacterium]